MPSNIYITSPKVSRKKGGKGKEEGELSVHQLPYSQTDFLWLWEWEHQLILSGSHQPELVPHDFSAIAVSQTESVIAANKHSHEIEKTHSLPFSICYL